jgi:hypothetical protein
LALWAAPLGAASFGSPGTTGASFLELPGSARAAGLAGTGVALGRGVEGLEYNPARLALLSGWDLAADQLSYLDGINLEQLGVGFGVGGRAGALGVTSLSSPDIPQTDAQGDQSGTFKAQDLAVSLGGALSWGQLSLGLTGRWVQQQLAGFSSSGPEGDVGLAWQPVPGWHVGAAAQHLGTESAFGSVADPSPVTLRGGVGWEGAFDSGFTLSLEADAVQPDGGSLQLRGGAEAGWSILFLRFGGLWSQDYDSRQDATLGLGLKLGSVTVDYAFADVAGLGATQRFGLSWRPGAALAAKPQGVPGRLRADRKGDDLKLTWDAVPGSRGYWVYVRRAGADPQRLGKAPIQGTSVRLHHAAAMDDLGLAVSSMADDGAEGPRSDELKLGAHQASSVALEAPQAVRVIKQGGRRYLTWAPGAGGDGQRFVVLAGRRSGSGYAPLGPPQEATRVELDPRHEWNEPRYVVVQALRRPGDGSSQESPLSQELLVGPR